MEVVELVEHGPAARAGLRVGDLIVAVEGEPVADMAGLQRSLLPERIGATTTITVARDQRLIAVEVTAIELDA